MSFDLPVKGDTCIYPASPSIWAVRTTLRMERPAAAARSASEVTASEAHTGEGPEVLTAGVYSASVYSTTIMGLPLCWLLATC
jgi:hypothetical protein